MNAAVAKIEPQLPQTHAPTPMDLLMQAVSGGNIELAEKLMGLQERWERNQARKAFDNAIASAKSTMPVIVKNRDVNFGQGKTSYKFEDLATIAKAVDPILAEHGLSYRFRTNSEATGVTVTCIVSHRDGHSEENSLTAGFDTSGSKNAIQALGSAVTYLQRYTLKAALGLASSTDDDGQGSVDKITDQQLADLISLADEVTADKVKFCKYMKVNSLADLPASKLNEAVAALEAKRKPK
jgi:hypothetical protein